MRRAFGHSQSCALSQPFCSEGWEMYKWEMMLFFCISSCVNCLWVCFFFFTFQFILSFLISLSYCFHVLWFHCPFFFVCFFCLPCLYFDVYIDWWLFFLPQISFFQLVGHNLKIGHSLGLFWFVPGLYFLMYYCRSFFLLLLLIIKFIINAIINAFFLVFRTKSEQTWALTLQN